MNPRELIERAREQMPSTLSYQLGRELEQTLTRISGLFDAIAHGDDEHRAWLFAKLAEHFGEYWRTAKGEK